jgi:hypothetical protein
MRARSGFARASIGGERARASVIPDVEHHLCPMYVQPSRHLEREGKRCQHDQRDAQRCHAAHRFKFALSWSHAPAAQLKYAKCPARVARLALRATWAAPCSFVHTGTVSLSRNFGHATRGAAAQPARGARVRSGGRYRPVSQGLRAPHLPAGQAPARAPAGYR